METQAEWQNRRTMTPRELQRALGSLGLSQAAMARYCDVNERTVRRYLVGDCPVPAPIVLLLRALLAYDVDPMVPERERRHGLPHPRNA